jgi:hypothetical protein
MDVGDYSSIDEVDECVIYKLVVDRTGVEDGEVGVFDTRRVEVRMRESARMQSHSIDRISFLATSLDSHAIPD